MVVCPPVSRLGQLYPWYPNPWDPVRTGEEHRWQLSQEKNLRPSKNVYKVVGHSKIIEKFLDTVWGYQRASRLYENLENFLGPSENLSNALRPSENMGKDLDTGDNLISP